jgi:group II intron reverse transcriptase/maturase
MPDRQLRTLAHHIDVEWLREAYRRTRKDGAVGVDGQTARQYAAHLEDNLRSLLDQAKTGRYRAPAVRRVHIPKGDGTRMRPIGIPTFEDKVLQRAVVMALEPAYEEDFYDFSYGFRPGRSAHDALQALWAGLMRLGGGWLLDVDIQSYFDTLDHEICRDLLRQRITDGVLVRLIGKWLNAGVLEGGVIRRPDSGTPQGGVISPLLANIYLHEVLDRWWVEEVQPRLRGQAFLIRYADDFVIAFRREDDARRVQDVLPKRFGKYGLTLHPEKTRMVQFSRPQKGSGLKPGTFDFLGFTHYWGQSRKSRPVVKRKTAKKQFSRACKKVALWCRKARHLPIQVQAETLRSKLLGHYNYYGITGNMAALNRFYRMTLVAWRGWLSRRSQRASLSWDRFNRLLRRHPLPTPRIARSVYIR